MVAVPPTKPVTTPPETDAVVEGELLHTPPDVLCDNVVVCPMQVDAVPVMVPAEGAATTVTVAVTGPEAAV